MRVLLVPSSFHGAEGGIARRCLRARIGESQCAREGPTGRSASHRGHVSAPGAAAFIDHCECAIQTG